MSTNDYKQATQRDQMMYTQLKQNTQNQLINEIDNFILGLIKETTENKPISLRGLEERRKNLNKESRLASDYVNDKNPQAFNQAQLDQLNNFMLPVTHAVDFADFVDEMQSLFIQNKVVDPRLILENLQKSSQIPAEVDKMKDEWKLDNMSNNISISNVCDYLKQKLLSWNEETVENFNALLPSVHRNELRWNLKQKTRNGSRYTPRVFSGK